MADKTSDLLTKVAKRLEELLADDPSIPTHVPAALASLLTSGSVSTGKILAALTKEESDPAS